MKRAVFFDQVRPLFGGRLSAIQVEILDALLDATEHLSLDHVAYILGTAFGESRMIPKREDMYYSAGRIKAVWPTRPEAIRHAANPKALANSVYGGRLGNRPGTDDGWTFRGGGLDQLTGRGNYAKVGIEDDPSQILVPAFAVKAIVHGMTTGRYTGKKLADYNKATGFDAVSARAIINGDVAQNGKLYASYAETFKKALLAAGWGTVDPVKEVSIEPVPVPVVTPVVAPVVTPEPEVVPAQGQWSYFLNALITLVQSIGRMLK